MKYYVAVAFLGLALIASRMLTGAPGTAQIAAPKPAVARAAVQPVATNAQTATLRVGNMYCPSCPYIVRRTLLSTPGVIEASVSLRDQLAVVRFDPAQTGIPELVSALGAIGYPSQPASNWPAIVGGMRSGVAAGFFLGAAAMAETPLEARQRSRHRPGLSRAGPHDSEG